MTLAQCNALITIVDDSYWNRAWCSVEALMVQTLCRSYHHHLWYEYALTGKQRSTDPDDDGWVLREGPLDLEIDMSKKGMTWEEDREKIMFLERQARLLSS
jgi:hypothetical protein